MTLFCIIQLKYGYEGYRQFPLPEIRFISRGAAEGNKHGQGGMVTGRVPKYTYLNCFIVPIQCIFVRSFTLVGFLLPCEYLM